MKIGLKQVDGKWSNLALMKIAAYHKSIGDKVEWYGGRFFEPYDRVYASKVFTFTTDDCRLPEPTIRGGSGYNLTTVLSPKIEAMFPDYSIYPKNRYAVGYTTRGCCRKCPFCIVPEKEGKLQVTGDLLSFWSGQSEVRMLDNNLTAAPISHFERLMEQFRTYKLSVDFSQGLDLRLLKPAHCQSLKGVRLTKRVHFAWDNMADEYKILSGLSLFTSYFSPNKVMVYVLIGFNTTEAQDLHRINTLRAANIDPFVMPFNPNNTYQKHLARWVNHKAIFKSTTWEQYNARYST